MNTDKKNDFPWETLDTTILMMPEELIVYHLYRLRQEQQKKKEKGIKDNKILLSSYLKREVAEKEEKSRCFQK